MQYIFTAILSLIMGLLIGLVAIDESIAYSVIAGQIKQGVE